MRFVWPLPLVASFACMGLDEEVSRPDPAPAPEPVAAPPPPPSSPPSKAPRSPAKGPQDGLSKASQDALARAPKKTMEVHREKGTWHRVDGLCFARPHHVTVDSASGVIQVALAHDGEQLQVREAAWRKGELALILDDGAEARFVWRDRKASVGVWTFPHLSPLEGSPAKVARGMPGWTEPDCPDTP